MFSFDIIGCGSSGLVYNRKVTLYAHRSRPGSVLWTSSDYPKWSKELSNKYDALIWRKRQRKNQTDMPSKGIANIAAHEQDQRHKEEDGLAKGDSKIKHIAIATISLDMSLTYMGQISMTGC